MIKGEEGLSSEDVLDTPEWVVVMEGVEREPIESVPTDLDEVEEEVDD